MDVAQLQLDPFEWFEEKSIRIRLHISTIFDLKTAVKPSRAEKMGSPIWRQIKRQRFSARNKCLYFPLLQLAWSAIFCYAPLFSVIWRRIKSAPVSARGGSASG